MPARYDGAAFRERFGPWVVIAGGSDGIGGAFAAECAARGLHVAAIARRREPLEALCDSIAAEYGVRTRAIQADLTAPDIASRVADATRDLDVGLYVSNAGSNPDTGRFLDLPVDAAEFLVSLSCRAVVQLTHHFGTRLRDRGRGGLVLMSSLACLAGACYQAVYSASKAFDTILAEGLWMELAPENVDVLGVLAGATRTETELSKNFDAFDEAMDPREVATGALDHLGKGPSFVPGAENRAAAQAMWAGPRVAIANGMTQAGAALFDLPYTPVAGLEFNEAD